jgi:hypothetical protein
MNYKARQEYLTSRIVVVQPGWNCFLGMWCVAMVSTLLLTAGCASESSASFPPGWRCVRLGMQRDQVAALAGMPAQANPSGTEEIYYKSVNKAHWELHVRYNAGGTVVERWWFYFK